MKITILIAACIIAGAVLFVSRKPEPKQEAPPFRFHSAERDGRTSTIIPLGKKKNLYVFGVKDGESFTLESVAYSLEGQVVFSHSDTTKDGNLDQLEYMQPPFSDMNLYTLNENGTYSKASKEVYDKVIATQEIYNSASKKAFSSATANDEEFKKVYEEAHKKVRELSETTTKEPNKAEIATPSTPSD